MKEKIKKTVLKPVLWFIVAFFATNNLFFTSVWGGNFEIDNTWYEYLLSITLSGVFIITKFAPNRVSKLYDKIFS
jgi:hypothetical protein